MNKIKIIWGANIRTLQNSIDEWSEKEKPNIHSTSLTRENGSLTISIVYSDNSENELDSLLKS